MIFRRHFVRDRKARQESLTFDLTPAESRAFTLFKSLLNDENYSPVSAALYAVSTVPDPDPTFVSFLSDGTLVVMHNRIVPMDSDGITTLYREGFVPNELPHPERMVLVSTT